MWIISILPLCACLSDAVRESFITLRDENFEGPDTKLNKELARRRTPPPEDIAEFFTMLNRSAAQPSLRRSSDGHDNETVRRQLENYVSTYGLRSGAQNVTSKLPEMRPLKIIVSDLILFLIYRVQQRLEDLRPILNKYEGDTRMRFGHIFCKLDKWKTELMTKFITVYRIKNRSVMSHLIYYEHLLAKNIDITYTIEYLIYLENAYLALVENKLAKYHVSKNDMRRYQKFRI